MRGKTAFADIEGLTQSVGAILVAGALGAAGRGGPDAEACGGISADNLLLFMAVLNGDGKALQRPIGNRLTPCSRDISSWRSPRAKPKMILALKTSR